MSSSSSSSSSQPQIPPEVLAQRQANITRINKLQKKLRRAVKFAPIILCSTHGIYDRSVEPVIWKVPKKTFIFEAQTIGDLTTTTIDVPLWELLQGGLRWGFMKYMTGDYSEIEQLGAEVHEHYKNVFSSLILYKPGDQICERVLSIGGGRDTKTSSARGTYEGMGFFRFDAGGPQYPYRGYGRRGASGEPNPYEILPQLHDLMVTNGDREMTDRLFVKAVNGIGEPQFRDGEPISASFASALPETGPEDYKIFIFSSCAAISEDSSPEGKKRWKQIARIQEQRKLEQMEMGLQLMGGQSGSMPSELVSGSSKNLRLKGAPPSGFFVPPPIAGAIAFFSQEDPELKPEELFEEDETEGGSLNKRTRKLRTKLKRTKKSKSRKTL